MGKAEWYTKTRNSGMIQAFLLGNIRTSYCCVGKRDIGTYGGSQKGNVIVLQKYYSTGLLGSHYAIPNNNKFVSRIIYLVSVTWQAGSKIKSIVS